MSATPQATTAAKPFPAKPSVQRSLMHKNARWLAQHGLPIFPVHEPGKNDKCSCGDADCDSPGKHPRTKNGFYDATTDLKQIDEWWGVFYPQGNIGVPTGKTTGLLVVDIDPRNGGPTDRSDIAERLGLLPETAEVITGSGGRHLYFKYAGGSVPPSLEPGIDLKGDGGYTILPPSLHSSGRRYEHDGLQGHKALLNPAPIPLPLLQRIADKLQADAAKRANGNGNHPADGERIPEGQRSSTLTSLAGTMRRRGMSEDEIAAALLVVNEKRCEKPLPESEVRTIAKSVGRYAPADDNHVNHVYTTGNSDGNNNHVNHVNHVPVTAWPAPLGDAAKLGLMGEFLKVIEPNTEADPAAMLVQLLLGFGNLIGRRAHYMVGNTAHRMNLFAVQVGVTSASRKGTAWNDVRAVLIPSDEEWGKRIQSGLASGEGLIQQVHDPILEQHLVKGKGKPTYYEAVEKPGVEDKRLLIVEPEFARVLQVCERETNTLSAVIREAWDSGNLSNLTRRESSHATGAHISIIGHITKDELIRLISDTAKSNGFGNRFLWVSVQRSKLLPDPVSLTAEDLEPLTKKIEAAVTFAKGVGAMTRSEKASALWRAKYAKLSEGKAGLLGAMTSRAEAQVTRLSCLYALLDKRRVVHIQHLQAALEVWRYCQDSAKFIFGDAIGDPMADEILHALKTNAAGMTRNELYEYFSKNKPSAEVSRALSVLAEHGRVRMEKERMNPNQKRPAERWVVIHA